MKFSNTYASLDEIFYEKIQPIPVRDPQLLLWNAALAEKLQVSAELENDPQVLAQVFSGNQLLSGSDSIAMAYAGHQFGNFVPQLGDGRAHLLGEVSDVTGRRWDIQLKGSGRTRYSRGGDGRCAIGPAVREFIMSEAMYALGIPTTRCLAVVKTGESVMRETLRMGAIVTRVASSHLRVGTFQYFAVRKNHQALKTLCDYTIARHYPELKEDGPNQYIQLVRKVMEKQIHLIVEWMRVGFIHGVMNTDNTSVSGETIDYGPCAMMGIYNPQTVYSSIDTIGRYAFANQPEIAYWNTMRFAESLLVLIDNDQDKAIRMLTPTLDEFAGLLEQAYRKMMGNKLGLISYQKDDEVLHDSILDRLKNKRMDYTNTFDQLTNSLTSELVAGQIRCELGDCYDHWKKRLGMQDAIEQEVQDVMRKHNPVVIPRNHIVEEVIEECEQTGHTTLSENFLEVLRSPYEVLPQTHLYQQVPSDGDEHYKTFCGT